MDKIALTLKEAAYRVPFSEDYLRKAVHRTRGNVLHARKVAGRITILTTDLVDWYNHEGEEL